MKRLAGVGTIGPEAVIMLDAIRGLDDSRARITYHHVSAGHPGDEFPPGDMLPQHNAAALRTYFQLRSDSGAAGVSIGHQHHRLKITLRHGVHDNPHLRPASG